MEITLSQYKAAYREMTKKKAKTGFYTHLMIFIALITVLWIINIITLPLHIWAVWPTLGWGSGMLSHWYFGVKRIDKTLEQEEREAEELASKNS